LLRLGFIGEEYAASRRILLRNLSGNGSHRSGKPPQPPVEPEAADNADDVSGEGDSAEPGAKKKRRFSAKKLFSALKLFILN